MIVCWALSFFIFPTAVVCCACPASRSDRVVLSGCGELARLTRPVARPGKLTARVPTSPASVDAPIFFPLSFHQHRGSLLPALPAALTASLEPITNSRSRDSALLTRGLINPACSGVIRPISRVEELGSAAPGRRVNLPWHPSRLGFKLATGDGTLIRQ